MNQAPETTEHCVTALCEYVESQLKEKRRRLDWVLADLAKDFARPGGPPWESSCNQTEWVTLRAQIRTLEEIQDFLSK